MPGRWTIKDSVFVVLICTTLALVLLNMKQGDRVWGRLDSLSAQVAENRQFLLQLEQRIKGDSDDHDRAAIEGSQEVSRIGESAVPSTSANDDAAASGEPAWARWGIQVVRLKPLVLPHDPRSQPGFRAGGTLVEIAEAQFPKITPYLYQDIYGERIAEGQVCESLATYDPETLEYRALLGIAYQYDPQGRWLRVLIDERARFSDGEPVEASDFVFTFHEFIMNPSIDTVRYKGVFNVISSVEAISDRVVEFNFVDPIYSNLERALLMAVLPEHFYSQFSPEILNQSTGLLFGSGPYRLRSVSLETQWSPPADVELIRNDRYWRERPPTDVRRFKVIADRVSRLASLESGLADIMRATPEQFRLKGDDADFQERFHTLAWNNMRSGYACLVWNCGLRNGKTTPFTDRRVRLAMTHILDRERMKRDFYDDLGRIATGPFSVDSGQGDPTIEPWPFSLERSSALLDEAGWIDRDGDGIRENDSGQDFVFEFTHASGSSAGPKLGAYLKDQCSLVGIRCNIRVVDWSIFVEMTRQRDFDAVSMQWSRGGPESDPFQMWHSSSIAAGGDNLSQWTDPRADAIIEEGRRTLDRQARMKLWHELHRLIHEAQPYTFLVDPPWIRFVSKRVQNVHPYPIGLLPDEMFIADSP